MKNVQQIRTMLPIGLRDERRVWTTSLRPGALLITRRGLRALTKHPKDLTLLAHNSCNSGIDKRDNDQSAVHPVPVIREVAVWTEYESASYCLHNHLHSKDDSKNMVTDAKNVSLS